MQGEGALLGPYNLVSVWSQFNCLLSNKQVNGGLINYFGWIVKERPKKHVYSSKTFWIHFARTSTLHGVFQRSKALGALVKAATFVKVKP